MNEKAIEKKDVITDNVFKSSVNSLEFTEPVGNKKARYSTDPKERDKKLKIIGKKIFRKNPNKKKTFFKIRINKVTRLLSQAEIDALLEDIGE